MLLNSEYEIYFILLAVKLLRDNLNIEREELISPEELQSHAVAAAWLFIYSIILFWLKYYKYYDTYSKRINSTTSK